MPEISIIIPVYNTEKYLKKCLDSVVNQTMEDIEIICVDDGSTDSSADILDAYARKDGRIRVIHKKNHGLVSARKTGIAEAVGKYAGYVDSDDWIEPDMYEKLFEIMEKNQVELVTCGYYLEGSYTSIHLDTVEGGFYDRGRMRYLRDNTIYRMECRETGIRGGLWCKLFSTALLKKVQKMIPDEITIAEDKVCLLRYMLECQSVYVWKEPLYHWVIRHTSMSHESREDHNDYLLKLNYVYNYLMTLYVHPNFTDIMRLEAEIYMMELMFLGINKRMGFQNKNMIWIDPCWLDRIPIGAVIVLYGVGELGEKYKRQLQSRPDIRLAAIVYDKTERNAQKSLGTYALHELGDLQYDYIVITVKNKEKAADIKRRLTDREIPPEKIIWYEQPEAYWRYIEAEQPGREMELKNEIGTVDWERNI